MTTRASAKRTYSLYLDDAENAALNRVAERNHTTVNSVCRTLIRTALGLPAPTLELPDEIREWAERRRQAAAADQAVA